MSSNFDRSFNLGSGERLLWSGAPRRGVVFRPSDAFLIPFSLVWGGFAVFWENGVIHAGAPFFFMLWGIPFVLIGIYVSVGRFFVDARIRENTEYALTNERVLIRSGLFNRSVTSLSLSTLPSIAMTERADGSGTISFDGNRMGVFNRPSLPGMAWPGAPGPTAFEMIPEVRTVYAKITGAQKAAGSQEVVGGSSHS